MLCAGAVVRYSPNLDCQMTIIAPSGYRLTSRFDRIEVYMPDDGCSTDYITVFDGEDTSALLLYQQPVLWHYYNTLLYLWKKTANIMIRP